MEEIWRDIVIGEDTTFKGKYQISNLGRIKRLAHSRTSSNGVSVFYPERILKPVRTVSANNYYRQIIDLRVSQKHHYFKVHVLVANAFLEPTTVNPDGTPIVGILCVNHKDENTENNCVDNLEYCDRAYNNRYSAQRKKERMMNENTLCET